MKNVLCIEIGEMFIKTCSVAVHDSGKMQIIANSCCVTPKNCCHDGVPLVNDALLDALNAEINVVGADIEDICFSVSSSQIDHTTLQIPRFDYVENEFTKKIHKLCHISEEKYKIRHFISDEWTALDGQSMISIDVFAISRYLIQQYEKLAFDLGKTLLNIVDPWYAMTAIYSKYLK